MDVDEKGNPNIYEIQQIFEFPYVYVFVMDEVLYNYKSLLPSSQPVKANLYEDNQKSDEHILH